MLTIKPPAPVPVQAYAGAAEQHAAGQKLQSEMEALAAARAKSEAQLAALQEELQRLAAFTPQQVGFAVLI